MDSFVIFEWEEVSPVSGDDEIGFAGNCTSEDAIVGRSVFDDVGNDFRCDDFCHSRKAFCPSFDLTLRPLEFLPEDVGELGYDSRGYKESVGSFEGMGIKWTLVSRPLFQKNKEKMPGHWFRLIPNAWDGEDFCQG